MKRKISIVSIIVAIAMLFSAFAVVAHALDADGDGYDDETGEYIGGGGVDPDPIIDPDPVEPATDEPYIEPVTDEPYIEPVTDAPYYPSYDDPTYPIYTYPDYYVEEEQDQIYNYNSDTAEIPTVPQNTAPSAPLYTTNKEVDKNVLSADDWSEISAMLKDTDSSAGDGDDFNFIKKNTTKGDNGDWMLYVAIALLAVGLGGIIYVVASMVVRRRRFATSTSYDSYDTGKASQTASAGGYNDGFSAEKKSSTKKSSGRRYDTEEINVPKSSGGKRFK